MKLNGQTIYGAAIAVITLVAFTELAYAEEYSMEQKVCVINTMSGYAIANAVAEAEANPDDQGKQMAAAMAPAMLPGFLMGKMLEPGFDWQPLVDFVEEVETIDDPNAKLDNGFMTLDMGKALIIACKLN